MDPNQIEDVLNVSTILSANGAEDAAHQPYLIAALIDWRDTSTPTPVTLQQSDVSADGAWEATTETPAKAKPKRGKATESDDSDVTTPDPSDDEPF